MPSKKSLAKKNKRVSKVKKSTKLSKTTTHSKTLPKVKKGQSAKKKVSGVTFGSTFWLVVLFCCLQFISGFLWYTAYAKTVLSYNVSPTVSTENVSLSGAPTEVIIPSAKIDLSVVPSSIEQGIWQIPDTSAAHLASSAKPGTGGNVIVYAHNKTDLFGNLKNVQEGDTITITTTSKTKHEYVVREKMVVKPQDISVAMPTDFEVLTVYTCTGFLDSQRLVLKAYPVRVSSI